MLRLSGLVLPFAALGDVLQSITRGFGRMRTTVMVERIGRPLAQLMLVVLAAPTHNVLLLVLAWTVPYLPATILSGLPVRRLARDNRRRRSDAEPSGFSRSEYWRFTGPRALISLTQVGLQRADVLLVVAILGPVQAALYAAATRFLVVGQLGNQAISVALQPRLSAALARRDLDEAGLLYRTTTGWLVLTTWPLYLLVGAFPAALLGIFGHKYASATDVVVVLCAAMLVATASGQVDTVLMMAGKSTWNLAKAVLALVVQLGLDLLLLPHLGILGAAIGWAVSILVANLVPLGAADDRDRAAPGRPVQRARGGDLHGRGGAGGRGGPGRRRRPPGAGADRDHRGGAAVGGRAVAVPRPAHARRVPRRRRGAAGPRRRHPRPARSELDPAAAGTAPSGAGRSRSRSGGSPAR